MLKRQEGGLTKEDIKEVSEKLEVETHKTSYTINPASSNRCSTYFDKQKIVMYFFFNMT